MALPNVLDLIRTFNVKLHAITHHKEIFIFFSKYKNKFLQASVLPTLKSDVSLGCFSKQIYAYNIEKSPTKYNFINTMIFVTIHSIINNHITASSQKHNMDKQLIAEDK